MEVQNPFLKCRNVEKTKIHRFSRNELHDASYHKIPKFDEISASKSSTTMKIEFYVRKTLLIKVLAEKKQKR